MLRLFLFIWAPPKIHLMGFGDDLPEARPAAITFASAPPPSAMSCISDRTIAPEEIDDLRTRMQQKLEELMKIETWISARTEADHARQQQAYLIMINDYEKKIAAINKRVEEIEQLMAKLHDAAQNSWFFNSCIKKHRELYTAITSKDIDVHVCPFVQNDSVMLTQDTVLVTQESLAEKLSEIKKLRLEAFISFIKGLNESIKEINERITRKRALEISEAEQRYQMQRQNLVLSVKRDLLSVVQKAFTPVWQTSSKQALKNVYGKAIITIQNTKAECATKELRAQSQALTNCTLEKTGDIKVEVFEEMHTFVARSTAGSVRSYGLTNWMDQVDVDTLGSDLDDDIESLSGPAPFEFGTVKTEKPVPVPCDVLRREEDDLNVATTRSENSGIEVKDISDEGGSKPLSPKQCA